MDWFLYDNGLRHERIKMDELFRGSLCVVENKITPSFPKLVPIMLES